MATVTGPELLLDLAPAGRPLRERVEMALRDAIRAGRLRPGDRLPATRTLAAELGCSRWVVVEAYDQLAAEGWVEGKPGSGTRVRAERAQAGVDHAVEVVRLPPVVPVRVGQPVPWVLDAGEMRPGKTQEPSREEGRHRPFGLGGSRVEIGGIRGSHEADATGADRCRRV
jgi:GntR family transcriptional regulator/MocR family aminotransferase